MDTNTVVQLPIERLIQLCSDSGPSAFEMLSLTATVVLGVLSIVLAYLVFRLSQGFEGKAHAALGRVDSLTTEIKQMVQSGLVDQREMSNKMLDSILSGNYGQSTPTTDTAAQVRDKDTLNKMVALIDARLSAIKSVDPSEIESLKHEITKLSQERRSEEDHIVSDALYRRISIFSEMPAFVTLVAAIVGRGLTSLQGVEDARKAECIPTGVETGITRLLDEKVLLGNKDEFRVNPEFEDELREFIDINTDVITQLKERYISRGIDEQQGTKHEERLIAQELVF